MELIGTRFICCSASQASRQQHACAAEVNIISDILVTPTFSNCNCDV